jgi:hypothetical protein
MTLGPCDRPTELGDRTADGLGAFLPIGTIRENDTQKQMNGSIWQISSRAVLPICTIPPSPILQIGISYLLGLMTSHDHNRRHGLWRERLRALGWIAYFIILFLLFLCFPLLML